MNHAVASHDLHAPNCRFSPEEERHDGGSLVCHCKMVREETVIAAVRDGARSVPEVAMKTGACTGCGACACRVNRVLMGLPAKCGGDFDHCEECGSAAVVCECGADAGEHEHRRERVA